MKYLSGRWAKTINSKSVRLAAAYLAIIVLLSVGFSVVFYRTSTANLNIQLQATVGRISAGTKSRPPQLPANGYVGTIVDQGVASGPNKDLASLNRQLRSQVDSIRAGLIRRLVVFNIATLLVGAMLCYYLARRTLRPIEAAAEAQSRFASEASHELRTPLTVMQSQNEAALRTLELSDPARAVLVSNLEEIGQLKALSESLLRLARKTDINELELVPVWADEVVKAALDSTRYSADAKNIHTYNQYPHVRVIANVQGLLQAITILLDNAITYSPARSTIYVEGRVDGGYAYLHVRDEGLGIGKKDLAHIFDRFYRARESRNQHPTGHGLGLSIARKLVEQQHGSITAESILGSGSTFTIKLPVHKGK